MSKNLYLELSNRSKQILKGVVESYLETGDPAGSETILKKVGIKKASENILRVNPAFSWNIPFCNIIVLYEIFLIEWRIDIYVW